MKNFCWVQKKYLFCYSMQKIPKKRWGGVLRFTILNFFEIFFCRASSWRKFTRLIIHIQIMDLGNGRTRAEKMKNVPGMFLKMVFVSALFGIPKIFHRGRGKSSQTLRGGTASPKLQLICSKITVDFQNWSKFQNR
jgi:hypothetical protein